MGGTLAGLTMKTPHRITTAAAMILAPYLGMVASMYARHVASGDDRVFQLPGPNLLISEVVMIYLMPFALPKIAVFLAVCFAIFAVWRPLRFYYATLLFLTFAMLDYWLVTAWRV